RTFLDWEAVLLDIGPGDTLTVSYRHGGESRTARLAVTDLPTMLAEKVSVLGGMKVVTVTAAVRAERGIQSDHGALIYDIPDEMQQATGLASGDVILQINRARVSSAEDLRRAFTAAAGAGAATVWFERGGARASICSRCTRFPAPVRRRWTSCRRTQASSRRRQRERKSNSRNRRRRSWWTATTAWAPWPACSVGSQRRRSTSPR